MNKSSTGINGIIEEWRPGNRHDSYRVAVTVPKQKWISPKVHPTLKQINLLLRTNRHRKEVALKDNDFQTLRHRLLHELKAEHALKEYRARERVELRTKTFNFEQSSDLFVETKRDTSVPMKHRSILMNFWLPFYRSKGCEHPREFISWRKQAITHVKTAKKLDGSEPYSIHSWVSLTNTHNEYMKFLLENGDITDAEFFTITARVTMEQKKRGLTKRSRKRQTYSEVEVIEIKKRIDETYRSEIDLEKKLQAYAIYFGVCTGLRRGNLLGLHAEDLYPDAEVPYFVTRDNVVSGWSRGIKGTLTLGTCTKTSVGTIALPMLQPSSEILVEVARFLKQHRKPEERLLRRNPHGVAKLWKEISLECGFKFLTPHDWKHSYATNGALHLQDWYRGNPYLLQMCCMHEKYETTLRYINQKAEHLLKAFQRG